MQRAVIRLLDSRWALAAASLASLFIGLFFSFVWAPHPWGWQGIDQYHELARALIRGESFGTTDVPWAYAYYVAAWYAIGGERTWLPVLGQVMANAAVPILLYNLMRPAVNRRTATLAALLISVFSFNTIYASTQASDALCTVLFMASLVCLSRGHRFGQASYFAIGGVLAGLVPQFRPNMVLLPFVFAGLYVVWPPRGRRHVWHAAVYLFCMALALAPWTVRNYNLTGRFLPTSTHGGVQLWYGSLQSGPYLEDRSSNPRAVFESPAFPYTSLANTSIIVSIERPACRPSDAPPVSLHFWTDRQPAPVRLSPVSSSPTRLVFEIPGQPSPTAIYYYVDAGGAVGRDRPFVYLVDTNHLGDLDRHDDLLDVFDLARMVRSHTATADLEAAVSALVPRTARPMPGPFVSGIQDADGTTILRLTDGSQLAVPAHFSDRVTDLEASGDLASALIGAYRLRSAMTPAAAPAADPCQLIEVSPANRIFYRHEVHMMGRYLALAFDNIERDPVSFAVASVYRTFRLFVIRASDDWRTSHQFAGAAVVYAIGEIASFSYFLLFLAGAVIAWRRRSSLLAALVPILYVPATISVVLTNMRYTTTVQPLLFMFIALTLAALLKLDDDAATDEHTTPALHSREP